MFDVKKFTSIERFSKFHFQDLLIKICNNVNLTYNIRRTKFCKNHKYLFKRICTDHSCFKISHAFLLYLCTLIAILILNYGLYENTVEAKYCILFLEKLCRIKLILILILNIRYYLLLMLFNVIYHYFFMY